MTIEESKQKLKKEGYTWFELKDLNEDFYEWLLPLKCNEENNLKEKITSLRVDINGYNQNGNLQYRNEFETHDEAFSKKEEFYNLVKKQKSVKNLLGGSEHEAKKISQMWYYTDLNKIIRDDLNISTFENYVKTIITYFFDFDEKQEYSFFAPMFTYYDNGCQLENHSDGTGTGRVCAFLLYLNETYNESDGGYLVLNDTEKVIPEFGRVAIIDLETFDIPHMVTEVTGGIGRYAILTFIKKKENELVDY